MPHIIVEYTDNIDQKVNFNALFKKLHHKLAEILGVEINLFQSRAIKCSTYYIANNLNIASVCMTIALLEGRSEDIRMQVKNFIIKEMQNHLLEINSNISCQISVEIRDIIKRDYLKEVSSAI